MTALLFPGQGTQRVGMGETLRRAFPSAVEPVLAAAAAEAPGLPLLLRRGPADRLAHTANAQVAVTAVNLCALAVLRERRVAYDAVAGHSVGLLSALVAAGALSAEDALRLALRRGALMGALPATGSMVAVSGIASAEAEAAARQAAAAVGRPVVVALVNGPEAVVLSGDADAVEHAAALVRGDRTRTTRLAVSHAFHSPLMRPALADWRRAVEAQPLRTPSVPVLADLDGARLVDADGLRTLLVEQMVTPVRWDAVLARLAADGPRECVETGDSKTLRAFARAYPELHVTSLGVPEHVAALRRRGRLPAPAAPLAAGAA